MQHNFLPKFELFWLFYSFLVFFAFFSLLWSGWGLTMMTMICQWKSVKNKHPADTKMMQSVSIKQVWHELVPPHHKARQSGIPGVQWWDASFPLTLLKVYEVCQITFPYKCGIQFGTFSSGRGNTFYLNLTEEDFVPDAVAANDPTADFSTFSLGSEVEQPTLQRAVSLAEDLQRTQRQNSHFFGWGRSLLVPAVENM